MGVDSNQRVGRLIEGITLLRRLWSEERVTHEGTYYRLQEVELLPKPVQQPVPIYIASNPKEERVGASGVERVLRRIAKYSDGWQTTSVSAQSFAERVARIQEYAAREGRDPSNLEFCLHLMVNINDDPEKALTEAVECLGRYYPSKYLARQQKKAWIAYGPPQDVIEKIRSYREAGCTLPIIRFCSPDTQQQVERFLKDVWPAFEKASIRK